MHYKHRELHLASFLFFLLLFLLQRPSWLAHHPDMNHSVLKLSSFSICALFLSAICEIIIFSCLSSPRSSGIFCALIMNVSGQPYKSVLFFLSALTGVQSSHREVGWKWKGTWGRCVLALGYSTTVFGFDSGDCFWSQSVSSSFVQVHQLLLFFLNSSGTSFSKHSFSFLGAEDTQNHPISSQARLYSGNRNLAGFFGGWMFFKAHELLRIPWTELVFLGQRIS